MYTAGIATGFAALAEDFEVPFSKLTEIISYPVLAQGAGNLFVSARHQVWLESALMLMLRADCSTFQWTPTAICIGKRPTIIASCALFLGSCIWSIEAQTINSLLASRVVSGFAAGSIESLGPAMIAGE